MRSGGRRGVAVVLLLGVFGVAGCGELDSSGSEVVHDDGPNNGVTAGSKADWYTEDDDIDDAPSVPTPTTEPIPTEALTYEPPEMPELDRTELDANLAGLSPDDRALVEHHLDAALGEGTWIVASPMTVAEARTRLLGPNPQPAKRRDFLSDDSSAYAFLQVGDGVVAWEWMGVADPPKRRLAWSDLQGPPVEAADWAGVGLAMAEKVTGVRATAEVQDVKGKKNWYAVPMPWGAMEDY